MYDWLDTAPNDRAHVVTASRRLARDLRREFAEQKVAGGETAWRTPAIDYWPDWLAGLLHDHAEPGSLPTLINVQQSRILWERCLRRETSDPLLNIPMLARQARDCYLQLQDWGVSVERAQAEARNPDQRLFARAADNYRSILDREGWADESQAAELVIGLAEAGRLTGVSKITLAGFDRVTPRVEAVLDAMTTHAGAELQVIRPDRANGRQSLREAENTAAEFRMAGAWARQELLRRSDARIAIVVTQLEQQAQSCLRLVKEGLIPGWQWANRDQNAVVNISYGQKLSDYPAVSVAVLTLSWLHRDLGTRDISRLLLSPLLGVGDLNQRSRLELRFREIPEQAWSPQNLLALFEDWSGAGSADDSLVLLRILAAQRTALPRRALPAEWVSLFSATLQALSWPGGEPVSSVDFQLVNRWRELLNEVARLDLVSPAMTAPEALGRIATIANETIFQAEAGPAAVQIMGPLEAAGLEFDKVWVSGMTSSNWPPPTKPLSLVSRELQREYGLPDATPSDTLDYAIRVIDRLAASAPLTVFSFAETHGDAQQTASQLLRRFELAQTDDLADPGWHATELLAHLDLQTKAPDPVPACRPGEKISGGADIIQQQLVEPFGAFVRGRLHVRPLWPMANGLPPTVRGQLIHAALQRLYADCPSHEQLRNWDAEQRQQRIETAIRSAFRRYLKHADAIQRRLLALEQERTRVLLQQVVTLDCDRDFFHIVAVEKSGKVRVGNLVLRLRIDRVDSDHRGELFIIDYKTGAGKRLLSRENIPHDMQLVVYTFVFDEPVGGIALVNIDSRHVALVAAGRDHSPTLDWETALTAWRQQVIEAACEIAEGDVRLNVAQPLLASRPLALLSRVRELQDRD